MVCIFKQSLFDRFMLQPNRLGPEIPVTEAKSQLKTIFDRNIPTDDTLKYFRSL